VTAAAAMINDDEEEEHHNHHHHHHHVCSLTSSHSTKLIVFLLSSLGRPYPTARKDNHTAYSSKLISTETRMKNG